MKYFISDNHWGHENIIRMSGRPFGNAHQMNMFMLEKWNETVKPEDEVYFLGDFMFRMNPTKFVNEILNNLNGKIYHIIGNHDEKFLSNYVNRVEWSKDIEKFTYNHNGKDYKFILCHYPIYSWNGMWRGSIHLHGHTHKNGLDLVFGTATESNKMNVNCEFIDYKPISIVDVIDSFYPVKK